MSDEHPNKPRYEPPPWEREAFERFRAERDEAFKRAELDEALRSMREPSASAPVPANGGGAPEGDSARSIAPGETGPTAPEPISEARIDAMLIQLKGEEPPISQINIGVVNALVAIFEVAGFATVVQAALLFGKVKATGAVGLLGALASMIVLLVGLGFMGAGFLLFRKHHS